MLDSARQKERPAQPAVRASDRPAPLADSFQAGGAALSALFPGFGALSATPGMDLNPFNLASRMFDSAPGRELGALSRPKKKRSPMRRRWDRYARMVRDAGGKVNPGGKPTVLGLRSKMGASSRYTDKFVVLTPDHRVKIFRGSTHPGQSSSSAATDANGDGVGDVGVLRPGNYKAVPNGDHSGKPSFHVTSKSGSDAIPGYRDTNHDGRYSAAEKRASRRRGDRVTEILFHTGGSSGVSSIGCMNLPPSTIDKFNRAVGGQGGRGFNFTLINA